MCQTIYKCCLTCIFKYIFITYITFIPSFAIHFFMSYIYRFSNLLFHAVSINCLPDARII